MPSINEQILTLEELKEIVQQRLDECMASDPECKLSITQQFKEQIAVHKKEIEELKLKQSQDQTQQKRSKGDEKVSKG